MALQNDTYGPAIPSTYSNSDAYGQPASGRQPLDSDNYSEASAETPASLSPTSLHDRLFGGQLQGQKYTLAHLDDKQQQRRQLHHRHIKHLDHRISKLQEDLSVATMNSSEPIDKDRIKLQSQINQLEKQKRKEELDYWEDMAEIKQENLETALEYEASRRRAGLFQGMEL